ncbi:MAG: hypothetical protein NXI10_13125 [bacterium]|nr:hypothetical protein [bacterium]
MKGTLFTFALIGLIFTGCQSKKVIATTEDIGNRLECLLSSMNSLEPSEFADHFISWKKLQEIVQNRNLAMDEEHPFTEIAKSEEELEERYEVMYRSLKVAGAELDLSWEKVEKDTLCTQFEEEEGVGFYKGTFCFKAGGNGFLVNSTSVYDGAEYHLVSLDSLRLKSN